MHNNTALSCLIWQYAVSVCLILVHISSAIFLPHLLAFCLLHILFESVCSLDSRKKLAQGYFLKYTNISHKLSLSLTHMPSTDLKAFVATEFLQHVYTEEILQKQAWI
jgi:hypothetical protein